MHYDVPSALDRFLSREQTLSPMVGQQAPAWAVSRADSMFGLIPLQNANTFFCVMEFEIFTAHVWSALVPLLCGQLSCWRKFVFFWWE